MAKKMLQRECGEQRLLTLEGLCGYISRGRNSARAWADEIGATIKFGKAVRFDRLIVDKALDNLNGEVAARD